MASIDTTTGATGVAATASVVSGGRDSSSTCHASPAGPVSASSDDTTKTLHDTTAVDPNDRASVLRRLRTATRCVVKNPSVDRHVVSTGSTLIDHLLPSGGLSPSGLVEWVADRVGNSAQVMAMIAAANHMTGSAGSASREADLVRNVPRVGKGSAESAARPIHRVPVASGPIVVVDPAGVFYPPAAMAVGIPEDRIILCRPQHHADAVFAADQAFRCPTVAAVLASFDERLDDRAARRFQLAAESGQTLGLLLRPAAVRGRPTFAETRFFVESIAGEVEAAAARRDETVMSRVRVTLDRSRGGNPGSHVDLAITDRGLVIPVQSPLRESLSRRPRDASSVATRPGPATRPAASGRPESHVA